MGGGASVQLRSCSCSVKSTALPYDVYESAKTGLPGPIIAYLKKRGNVNAVYKGETMLHAACSNGRENVLTMLLNEKDLCLNIRNNYNETGLMMAASNGYRDCVEIILVHNNRCPLEIYCKNNNNLTAIDIAHINNRQDVAYCMMSFIKNRPPPTGNKFGNQAKEVCGTSDAVATGTRNPTNLPGNNRATATANK